MGMDNPTEDKYNFWVLQQKLEAWRKDCFGDDDGDIATNQLLGVMEELGELTHHYLKQKQGIRTDEDHEFEIRDAVADITIFLIQFCTQQSIVFQDTVVAVAEKVMQRTRADQMTRGGDEGK